MREARASTSACFTRIEVHGSLLKGRSWVHWAVKKDAKSEFTASPYWDGKLSSSENKKRVTLDKQQ